MNHLSNLTTECGFVHVPNGPTHRIVLFNAGVKREGPCPRDERLDHVTLPSHVTAVSAPDDTPPAIIFRREDHEIARVVPDPAGKNAFTITTTLL